MSRGPRVTFVVTCNFLQHCSSLRKFLSLSQRCRAKAVYQDHQQHHYHQAFPALAPPSLYSSCRSRTAPTTGPTSPSPAVDDPLRGYWSPSAWEGRPCTGNSCRKVCKEFIELSEVFTCKEADRSN